MHLPKPLVLSGETEAEKANDSGVVPRAPRLPSVPLRLRGEPRLRGSATGTGHTLTAPVFPQEGQTWPTRGLLGPHCSEGPDQAARRGGRLRVTEGRTRSAPWLPRPLSPTSLLFDVHLLPEHPSGRRRKPELEGDTQVGTATWAKLRPSGWAGLPRRTPPAPGRGAPSPLPAPWLLPPLPRSLLALLWSHSKFLPSRHHHICLQGDLRPESPLPQHDGHDASSAPQKLGVRPQCWALLKEPQAPSCVSAAPWACGSSRAAPWDARPRAPVTLGRGPVGRSAHVTLGCRPL